MGLHAALWTWTHDDDGSQSSAPARALAVLFPVRDGPGQRLNPARGRALVCRTQKDVWLERRRDDKGLAVARRAANFFFDLIDGDAAGQNGLIRLP